MTFPKHKFSLDPSEFDALTRIWFYLFVLRVIAEVVDDEFLDNWHIWKLCAEADRIRTDPNTRLTVAVPPRSMKSAIFSVALPAWLLGHNPMLQIVCVSYGQELTDDLADKCRRVMNSAWYRRLFPGTILARQATHHLVTTAGGKRYGTSTGGALTGIGADVAIIDDPIKPTDDSTDTERLKVNEWAGHTLSTRFNDKRDVRCVNLHQRLHENDLIGHVTEIGGYEHISFAAIAQEDETIEIREPFGVTLIHRQEGDVLHPEREPLGVLEFLKRHMGTAKFAAQYLQRPTPPGGLMIKSAWFPRYARGTEPVMVMKWQSWDTAAKTGRDHAYSACVTFGIDQQGQIYILDVYRAKLEYPELKRKIRELAILHGAGTILIEEASSGTQLVQELSRDGFAYIVGIKPKGPKEMRMLSQTAMIEAGKVFLPHEAHWLPAYLEELDRFPNCRFKDQVDATSQGLEWSVLNGGPARWLAMIDIFLGNGLGPIDPWDDPVNQTVSFDHPEPGIEFKVSTGRMVKRSIDGLFHVTPGEWEGVRLIQGVQRIGDGRPGGG